MDEAKLFDENVKCLVEAFAKINDSRPEDRQFSEFRLGEMARDLIDLFGLGTRKYE